MTTDRPPSPAVRYGAVVPVKPLAAAKSRLAGLGRETRRGLVKAFVCDTVLALLDCPCVAEVLVVTDEAALAAELRELGVVTIPDGLSDDLNGTLVQGAAEMRRRWRQVRLLAICADLPALRAVDLVDVLDAAPADRAAFVSDLEETGTTLYTAPTLERFDPRFGSRSRQAHLDAGAAQLDAAPSVRRDVDTPEDLREAITLGVGRRTSWLVATAGLAQG